MFRMTKLVLLSHPDTGVNHSKSEILFVDSDRKTALKYTQNCKKIRVIICRMFQRQFRDVTVVMGCDS